MEKRYWQSRIKRIISEMEKKGIDCLVSFKPQNTFYISGFNAIYYSRPVVVILPLVGEPTLIIPFLREEHAKEESWIKDIRYYVENPIKGEEAITDPIVLIQNVLSEKSLTNKNIGIEKDYITLDMYRELERLKVKDYLDSSSLFTNMRIIKDEIEIDLIRKSAYLTDIGMEVAINSIRERKTEIEVCNTCEAAMANEWARSFPEVETTGIGWAEGGVVRALWCICLSGPRLPLITDSPTDRKIQEGDLVAVGILATCNGYNAENERMVVVGKPTEKQKFFINTVLEARQQAMTVLRPGVKCYEVDRASRKVFEQKGVEQYIRTRTGHGIGLGNHEPPNFREEDDTIVQKNMVVSIEPGLNAIPNIGGIRISDTLLITEKGFDFLTKYNRELISV